MTNTKIVATLGPACSSPEMIRKLIQAGVDVFRLNASHGTVEQRHEAVLEIRKASEELKLNTGILLDLQGPKIRIGTFEGGSAVLLPGAEFVITTEDVIGNTEGASTTYKDFARDVKSGDRVLLADGALELIVIDCDGIRARCRVVRGGVIKDKKGINLPGVQLSTPSMTRRDMENMLAGLSVGVDLVALSFVRRSSDVLRLRLFLEEKGSNLPIIAKIEKPEAVENIKDILSESDGVMVARGDLGVECPMEKVPFIQKSIIESARRAGKFVITATQMLESMIENPFPTRAEVSDVANAIYDGTDAVMLSGETSVGKYPVEAVSMMDRTAAQAEESTRKYGFRELPTREYVTHAEIVSDSAYHAAKMAGAQAIVVFSSSGSSARHVARFRPPVPIFVFTQTQQVARSLSVVFGISAIVAPHTTSTDEMMAQMDRVLVEKGLLKPRDSVVFVAGMPIGRPGSTNMMKLHRVGEIG
ncbi:pyruvate kinase [Paludibaculum fermentans]|uniref:Pyruvate kinase n=1 Tax=Paludibaculum fermentans TaxID=1473598 RepID=A0A7S7SJ14_PALFE|nr:pyruvate kinase [Paludibaculum fermentans]QOY85510.1 pyruvate kinase [Paludibaculum fermentans]